MKKIGQYEIDSENINELINQLGQDSPVSTEEKKEESPYISSFKENNLYQWPVRVRLSEYVDPEKLTTKHFTDESKWEKIDKDKNPYLIGGFAPGVYVNETHKSGHNGTDISAIEGVPIYPIAPGLVKETTEESSYPIGGNTVTITHDDGSESYYAHMQKTNISSGSSVDFNTIIGYVGKSGNARQTSPHLHFQVRDPKGQLVDPQSIIGKPVGFMVKSASELLYTLEKYADDPKKLEQVVQKITLKTIAETVRPEKSYKEKIFAKIINQYLINFPLSGEEIIDLTKSQSPKKIGKIVRNITKLASNNLSKEDAKQLISSFLKSS